LEVLQQIMYVFIDLFTPLSRSGEWHGYFPGNFMDGLREETKHKSSVKF
jgi:hypothetical protein